MSTLALALLVRKRPRQFALTLVAFVCIVGTQVVFWTFTFPTNQETNNWTVLPDHWMARRARWEYSHATSAVLNLIALVALICAVLTRDEPRPSLRRRW